MDQQYHIYQENIQKFAVRNAAPMSPKNSRKQMGVMLL